MLNLGEKGDIVNVREGKTWDKSKLEYIKAKAFRLVIDGASKGTIGIDGEFYQGDVIQGVVVPKGLCVFHL